MCIADIIEVEMFRISNLKKKIIRLNSFKVCINNTDVCKLFWTIEQDR